MNCNNEASRWSFTIKLNEKLRLWHNDNCNGLSAKESESWRKANFYARFTTVMKARNEQVNIARTESHWNPKIPDHVSNGIIKYPSGLNQDNEGSCAAFLFGLMDKLKDRDSNDIDVVVVQEALTQAKQDATTGIFWNPSLEVIING